MPEHQLSKEQEQPIVQKRTSNNDGKTVQRAEREAVSPFGGKSFWHKSNANVIQGKGGIGYPAVPIFGNKQPIQQKADTNNTGLPDNLKSGIENLSGYSMDDVKVHYNSDKPAQLQAHAYAQGTDIHLGAGQEKHLPHEAWHVVQQKQGRVKPTVQMKGKVNVNDDKGLEKEADVMGAKALQMKRENGSKINSINTSLSSKKVIQQQKAVNNFSTISLRSIKSVSSNVFQRVEDLELEVCEDLLTKIIARINELKKRYYELIENKLNLPQSGPMSIDGHKQQFRDKQKNLRKLLDEWNTGNCGDKLPLPERVWEWATKSTPSPAPKTNPATNYQPVTGQDITVQDVAQGAGIALGVAATGYLVYRAARMLPSLLPPLWWTIPANVVMP